MDCDRVSWGPFERPLRLLFESHSKETPPANCTDVEGVQGNLVPLVLNSLWVEDVHLAVYLKGIYDLPIVLGTFNVTTSIQNGVGNMTWRWTPRGGETSHVTFNVFNYGERSQAGPETLRLAWYNATQLSYMDLRHDPLLDQFPSTVAPGTMKPPMLYATKGQENYVGTGDKYDNIELAAKIKRYRDYECKEPLQ